MAKRSAIEKNKKRIKLAERYSEKRATLKKQVKDLSLSLEDRLAAQDELQSIPRNASPVRVRKRCSVTGRPRGYIGIFGLSRIKFRELALLGFLPGVKKTSW